MQMSPRTPFRGRLLCNSKSRSNRCGFFFVWNGKIKASVFYRWSFWEGENDAVFDANREISFTEYTIQKGKRYYNFSSTEKVVLGYAFVSKD